MPPTNTLARETKTLAFSIKATGITTSDDGQEFGQIECYGAIFDNVDDGNDRINKGAFTRTIQNSKARAKARQKKYILPILWQHDTNELIGGWYDLKEDDTGLLCKGEVALATQRGREYYALAKAGMSDQFSIIYDIPTGGAKYDKSGVRDLTEIRLFSIDVVTFAMNDETRLVGVKSMDLEYKSVCGDTSLPIGARDASWDGSAAKKQIFSYAEDGDSFDVSKLKKCFLKQDGDPQTKGSWGYPFVNIVDGSPQINVAGVKACAGALSGARNADAGSDAAGMKRKVATMYNRINKKYPDAEPLTPPWEDDGKASDRQMQRKTFMEHYNEEMCEDLLSDLQEVWFTALCKAVVDAFKIGDTPQTDIPDALDDFKSQFMKDWVGRAMECGLSEYLASDDMDSPLNTMYGGYGSYGYGYMSSNRRRSQKAGRAISASNQTNIDNHVNTMHDMANKMMADMKAHTKAMHGVLDDFADSMAGSQQAAPDDSQDDDEEKSVQRAVVQLRALRK
jgi:HK97 family phage prohead protease